LLPPNWQSFGFWKPNAMSMICPGVTVLVTVTEAPLPGVPFKVPAARASAAVPRSVTEMLETPLGTVQKVVPGVLKLTVTGAAMEAGATATAPIERLIANPTDPKAAE
jgi:hypothetical protein